VTHLAREDPQGFLASDLATRTGGDVDRVDNEAIVAAFRTGDPWTRRAVQRLVDPLGQVLAAIHLTVGVERFVIVGGFALALGPWFREMLAAASHASAWDLGADWDAMIELSPTALDAGLIGAGVFASSRATGR
jgi:predicted NBD/HSP70 family sugar kinase